MGTATNSTKGQAAMEEEIEFQTCNEDGYARTGILTLSRGRVRTPAFMPVGTGATVKAMWPENVAATGADILLCNTYHLMLRPGAECIESLGGLHRFMNWNGPILTDSGGFQVMSQKALRKIGEAGVEFRSFIDGTTHFMSPERSIEIQRQVGADISMCFDECTPFPATPNEAETSMLLSVRWADRSRAAFGRRPGFALFGIQQGSIFPDLRKRNSEALVEIGFDGYAVGGLAVGEGQDRMFEVLDYAPRMLPADRPRYLMGVGKPEDIVGAVQRGIDMFDCVLPTRSGRTGQAFSRFGEINIKNARYAGDEKPLDPHCDCPTCRSYSRAYLHHMFKAREIICSMLMTWHNLHYYQMLMKQIRSAICERGLNRFAAKFHDLRCRGIE